MKAKLTLLPMVLVVLAVGCKTLPDWITPSRVETVTRLAAYSSAKALLIKQSDSRAGLEKARDGFAALEASQKWDIATAASIAATNGLDWLSSPEGNLALTGGVMFIDLILGKQVELSGDVNVRAFIVGARSGLDLALAAQPAASTPTRSATPDPTYQRLLKEAQATRTR